MYLVIIRRRKSLHPGDFVQITTVPGSGFTNNRVVAAQSLAEFRLPTARSARVALYARIPHYLEGALSQVFEVVVGAVATDDISLFQVLQNGTLVSLITNHECFMISYKAL